MQVRDDRGVPTKKFSDGLLDHGRVLACVVICGTLLMAVFIPAVQKDPSLKSVLVTSSDAYIAYQEFTEIFGKDDFLVVMIRNKLGAGDPRVLAGLKAVTDKLREMDKIADVVSLSTVKLFQKRGKRLGNYPILRSEQGMLQLPDPAELEKMRKAIPLLDLMISRDLKSVGILVRIQDQWRFDGESVDTILRSIKATVKKDCPPGSDVRIIGTPVLGQAIVKYSDRTAVVFGILCTIICTGVTVYVFRNPDGVGSNHADFGHVSRMGARSHVGVEDPPQCRDEHVFRTDPDHQPGSGHPRGSALSSVPRLGQRSPHCGERGSPVPGATDPDLFHHHCGGFRRVHGHVDPYGV